MKSDNEPAEAHLAAMIKAKLRSFKSSWQGDVEAAEECCHAGWLRVVSLTTRGKPEIVYELSPLGRVVLERARGGRKGPLEHVLCLCRGGSWGCDS